MKPEAILVVCGLMIGTAMIPVVVGAGNDERVEEATYIALTAWVPTCPGFGHPGGACFEVKAEELEVEIELLDELNDGTLGDVPMAYGFWGEDGLIGGVSHFCGSANIEIPPGAMNLDIVVHDPGFGTLFCGPGSHGTTGTIVATFRT